MGQQITSKRKRTSTNIKKQKNPPVAIHEESPEKCLKKGKEFIFADKRLSLQCSKESPKQLRNLQQPPLSLKMIKKSPKDCVICLLYTSPSPRDLSTSRMPSSA
eukprot:TRINITY_DN15112_c0_g1_i1.p2 TRINITY_DN15112_c0_g1~~TRINITY_DN15112_c0_g1_i1.p2  ORF type:complete len:104 (+),score=44.39 TRINITY_DN15112_c0_g1_i1:106-417(+)